jgi:hypothetical protein
MNGGAAIVSACQYPGSAYPPTRRAPPTRGAAAYPSQFARPQAIC